MTAGSDTTAIRVTVRGHVHDDDRDYALSKIAHILPLAHAPVLSAHLMLGWEPDPAQPRRAHLEIGLDLNGVPVRARIAAEGLREGADLLQDRLRRSLLRLQSRQADRHRGFGSGHHARRPDGARVAPVPRRPAPEPGEVVRRKTFALRPLTPEQAGDEMELLDHDFYLYTDVTGAERVICREPDGTVTILTTPAELGERAAIERLELGGEPFVFHRNPGDGRGRVLYRRFDGRYGLIVPA